MWVILTDPTKKGNKWSRDDFFATGRQDVETSLQKLQGMGIQISFGRALDFGCGLGRLSQGLASHFAFVDGVDVSASMIEQAKTLNNQPPKVTYHLNVHGDLSNFASGSYDFVFSIISLQHTPTRFQRNYISDFVRLLKPGGVAFFQTIHTHGWRRLVPDVAADLYRKLKHKGKAFIPMYGIPISRVRSCVETRGGIIHTCESSPCAGYESRFVSDQYVVRSPAA
ncbi:MAG TPA: class I SAM-dependent methyltransferase [Candidatus Binatia bacterium]|nr:class I SAM-dependent methyltransferase [Candidatus Binatia bacterium]